VLGQTQIVGELCPVCREYVAVRFQFYYDILYHNVHFVAFAQLLVLVVAGTADDFMTTISVL